MPRRLERAQTGLPVRKMGINDAIVKYLLIGHAGSRFTDLEHQSNPAELISAPPGGARTKGDRHVRDDV
jgi:hypothetical protein